MSNMLDYIQWRGDLTFDQSAFNPIDSLILSRLSYLPFDEIFNDPDEELTIEKAAGSILDRIEDPSSRTAQLIKMPQDVPFMKLLRDSERFRDLSLFSYVNKIDETLEQQFSATTIRLDPNTLYLSFRGTDNTFIGWKEDFNMNFLTPIPSQRDSADYLTSIALANPNCHIYVGGHSKGGNLAVYASAFCDPSVQPRIHSVYNYDGPGFYPETLMMDGYQRVKNRISTYLPQSSVFGMMLEHESAFRVVRSSGSGLTQHDLYTWDIERSNFIELESVTAKSRFYNRTIKDWVFSATPEQREKFIDLMYEIFRSTNAKSVSDLTSGWYKYALTIIKSYRSLNSDEKKVLKHFSAELIRAGGGNLSRIRKTQADPEKPIKPTEQVWP